MGPGEYLTAGTLAVLIGLDRVAFLQSMVCRPLVAATLTGWLLGIPLDGLQVGILLELLWLGRLPVGAAIPPDDTQVAIGATVLALTVQHNLDQHGTPVVILAVLAAIPLGMVGQICERWVRRANGRLETLALGAAAALNVCTWPGCSALLRPVWPPARSLSPGAVCSLPSWHRPCSKRCSRRD
jgi:PTS system mannose-specific IIC component